MSSFRTDFKLPDYPFSITHGHKILSLGSCFAEHIGEKMTAEKFRILRNPFGIIYNPASTAEGLRRLFAGQELSEDDIFQHNDLWHSRLHHSTFSRADKDDFLTNIQAESERAAAHLRETNRLFLTFGTAYVWEEKTTGRVNANCHKRPQREFRRRRLSVREIVGDLLPILEKIKAHNPNSAVLLTVSPVRHVRDGMVENQRSKAVLHLAAEELCAATDFVHYFPAYEMMQDDLRDYRFYTADMLHPNETATAYIYGRFREAFFDSETEELCKRIAEIKRAAAHRPFRADSAAHRDFLRKYAEKTAALQREFPNLDFAKERDYFASLKN